MLVRLDRVRFGLGGSGDQTHSTGYAIASYIKHMHDYGEVKKLVNPVIDYC